MFALRYIPTQKFIRVFRTLGSTPFVPDGDLKVNKDNLLILPDLWTATQWVEKQLKNQPIEIVELEMREVRVVPPMIDIEVQKNEAAGNQLSKLDGVRP
jgi:hypothetical protein